MTNDIRDCEICVNAHEYHKPAENWVGRGPCRNKYFPPNESVYYTCTLAEGHAFEHEYTILNLTWPQDGI